MREPNNRGGNERCVELKIRNGGCWNEIPCNARRLSFAKYYLETLITESKIQLKIRDSR